MSSTPRSLGPSTSTNNPPSYDESRQQAGPLPSKRGEIGFIEEMLTPRNATFEVTLPARHPADRDHTDSPTVAVPLTPVPHHVGAATNAPTTTDGTAPSSTSPNDQSDKPNGIMKYLKPKPIAAFQGLSRSTLLAFLAQFLVFSACVIAWGFTGKKLATLSKGGTGMPGGIPSVVFLHFVFAFAVIGQLVFLERRVYRLRAERYTFLHPGEMLPQYHDRTAPGGDLSFAFAPWNRPPLPTYAAALAQSGHGTGDVDDHLIAVPPPPAYGNTRGSTLLLAGFLRNSLRAQRPVSVHSEDLERGDNAAAGVNRESHIQQTLAQLERASSRTSR